MQKICKVELLGREFDFYQEKGIDEIYVLAKDVADILEERDGYTVARKVDESEKVTRLVCTPGGKQETTFLTENGLYEAIFNSKKSIAKQFKAEVKRVLKDIRKNGYYIATEKDNNWLLTRQDTKIVRKQETDKIKELVEYAKLQGSEHAERYYITYTNLANKKIGINSKERDNLNQHDLMELKAIETIIKRKIQQGIDKQLHYKEIYKMVKDFIELI